MKELLRDFLEFYRNSLLVGFFRKRGKSLIVPHLLFCIERILSQFPEKEEIFILDLGTGEGHLLRLIEQLGKIAGFAKKLRLYGFDFDEGMLESAAKQNNIKATFVKIDLRHDMLTEYYDKFDLIVAVNTLHEVFSSYIGEDNEAYPEDKIVFAKQKINELILELGKMLTSEGTFILYDGLAPRQEIAEKNIRFRIKNEILARYFSSAINDFSLWKIKFKFNSQDGTYTMKYRDFSWFIITFKYLNTKLWPFESKQTYQYFSKDDFAKAFKAAGLMRESILYVNSDLGLWKNNIAIESSELDYPPKSILIVASKHYIPSQYDYFGAK